MNDTATADDARAAILATVLDYYEGWFDGDAARMASALHPDLAKRSLEDDQVVETITAREMIDGAAEGLGRREDPDERRVDICVDHVQGSIATAHASGAIYVDYLQLVLVDEHWRILNALWAPA
ncbi:MAG: nuclear transport factor 2 family protein [Actinomycetes bacterium]